MFPCSNCRRNINIRILGGIRVLQRWCSYGTFCENEPYLKSNKNDFIDAEAIDYRVVARKCGPPIRDADRCGSAEFELGRDLEDNPVAVGSAHGSCAIQIAVGVGCQAAIRSSSIGAACKIME